LQLPAPEPSRPAWSIAGAILMILLAVFALLPPAWLNPGPSPSLASFFFCVVAVLVLLVALLVILRAIRRELQFGRSCAAYFGSLARTIIPVIALALILVNICSRPYLRWSERRWLERDTLLAIDREGGGFTAVETRLTERLRTEIAEATASLPR
jgi:hypothetical protein